MTKLEYLKKIIEYKDCKSINPVECLDCFLQKFCNLMNPQTSQKKCQELILKKAKRQYKQYCNGWFSRKLYEKI